MATETRVLRPFASPPVLQDVLDRTTLRVGSQQLDAGGRIVVDHYEFLHLPVTLRLGGEVGRRKKTF